MRSLFLLLPFPMMVLGLGSVSRAQDRQGAPNVRLTSVFRKVQVLTYPGDKRSGTVEFIGTPLAPKAGARAKIESSPGGVKIEAHFSGLGPAANIDPGRLTYVLWAISSNGEASNLGELIVKKTGATLTTSTASHSFAMMVTAEPYFAVKVPSDAIVLYNVLLSDRNLDPSSADLLPIHPNTKAPLDMFEARNAIRIARLAGAERYAAETFRKAQQLLQQAETISASQADRDNGTVEEKSRQATETAEDARSEAVQRQQEPASSP